MTLVGRRLTITLSLLLVLTACEPRGEIRTITGDTMGTTYNVKIFDKSFPRNIQFVIDEELERINLLMSTYIEDSQISQFNRMETMDPMPIDPDLAYVLEYALELSANTGGLYDPTVGPLVDLWGFGPQGPTRQPSLEDLTQARINVGAKLLNLQAKQNPPTLSKAQKGVAIDLSSIAKGFAVDEISLLLEEKGFVNHLVEIGGEMTALGKKGRKPWIAGIETPNKGSRSVMYTLALENQSIATSGNYRNYLEYDGTTFAHTIDPAMGMPVDTDIASVTVVAETCMVADALATALMTMSVKSAQEYATINGVNALLIAKTDDGAWETISVGSFPEVTAP